MAHELHADADAAVRFDDAIGLLATDADRLLQDATDASAAHADQVRTELHVELAGVEIGREVVITAGEFDPVEMLRSVRPVAWEAASAKGLFPSLEGTLELRAVSLEPPLTRVTLVGTYDPPLGPVGEIGDALLGHRIAEAAVQHFVDHVADRLRRELRERPLDG